jgi:hypothetical protein
MDNSVIGASGIIKTYQDDRGNIIIDIDPTFKGQVSINTVGTISIGDWQANIIASKFGGTGCDNEGSSLKLNGNTVINCPLIITCDDGDKKINLHVSKSGSVALKEDSLQLNNMLSEFKDEGTANLAYDNISPSSVIGDITYHDGLYNKSLTIGEEGTYLSVEKNIPTWKRHPQYLRYIKTDSNTFENEILRLTGIGIIIDNDENAATNMGLNKRLESLCQVKDYGFLTLNTDTNNLEARVLIGGNGISIANIDGYAGHPIISIKSSYEGQKTIQILGIVKIGKWEAEVIRPEFGGTGFYNKHSIKIGGQLSTNCPFTVRSSDIGNPAGVLFYTKTESYLELPESGTLATVQESLQIRHNLLDIGNPVEAFRNISPTKQKGDLIIRGPGDYDERLPVGKDGQILIATTKDNLGVEWVDLNLEEKIEKIVEKILLDEEKKNETQNKKKSDDHIEQLQKFIEAIMSQFDHMARTNQIKLLSEMKSALQEWKESYESI